MIPVEEQKMLDKEYFKSISIFTFFFKDEEFEENYKKYRSDETESHIIVLYISFLICGFMALRMMTIFFQIIYGISTYTFNPYISLANSLTWIVGIGCELIIIATQKCLFLKGFLCTVPDAIFVLYQSYLANNSVNNPSPFYAPLFVSLLVVMIAIAIMYCYNWISGAILIFIVATLCQLYILSTNWTYLDQAFVFINNFLAFSSIVFCLRYGEYKKRKAFFQMSYAFKQKENTFKILSNLPDPVIVSEKGKIILVNKAFKDLMIHNKIQQAESPTSRIISPCNLDKKSFQKDLKNTDFIENIESKETFKEYIVKSKKIETSNQFSYKRPNVTKSIPLEINSTKITIHSKNQMVYSIKDLSLYHKLNEIQSKQKYSRMFVSSVSHEFRTSINIIQGSITNIEHIFSLDASLEAQLNSMKKATEMIYMLVLDLIDFSLLKENKFNLNISPLDIKELINESIYLFLPKFEEKNLFLKVQYLSDIPDMIYTDNLRVKQIIFNLIKNAFKFTLEGGVYLEILFSEQEAHFIIKVIDTGIGIKKEDIPLLFKPFCKLEDPQNLNANGVGLGMNICKKIAKRMKGSLNVTSEFGKGSEFSFTFSVASKFEENKQTNFQDNNLNLLNSERTQGYALIHVKNKEPKINLDNNISEEIYSNRLLKDEENKSNVKERHENRFNTPRRCECPKILIVDDEEGNRIILGSYCKRLNLNYQEAINGLIALEKVKKYEESICCKNYILIFMDYNMPIMNGETATLEIKKYFHNTGKSIPKVICITANATVNNTDNMTNSQIFDQIVYKPLKFDQFKHIINQILNE